MAPLVGREGSLGTGRSLGRGARSRILEAAGTLFARQGFNATSINELRAQARVSKRTLYQHFDSKDELVLAFLAESESASPVAIVLAREELAPRARLLELFTSLTEHSPPGAPDPFLAAAVEFPDPDHPVHRAAAEHSERFARQLGDLARAAGAREPDRVGRRLALLYNGAAARALTGDRAEVVNDAHALAAAVLRDAID